MLYCRWSFTQFREKLPRLGVGEGEFANSKEDGRAISLKGMIASRFSLGCLNQAVHAFRERIAYSLFKVRKNLFPVSSQARCRFFHGCKLAVHHPAGQSP